MCHGAGMIFSLAPIFFGGYAEIMDRLTLRKLSQLSRKKYNRIFWGCPHTFMG
jgi:hypothetical protein